MDFSINVNVLCMDDFLVCVIEMNNGNSTEKKFSDTIMARYVIFLGLEVTSEKYLPAVFNLVV